LKRIYLPLGVRLKRGKEVAGGARNGLLRGTKPQDTEKWQDVLLKAGEISFRRNTWELVGIREKREGSRARSVGTKKNYSAGV